ncbi:MAG: CHAT domain-containing protein, partial [bacterium]
MLRLRIQPPELTVLPWELLYDSERHFFLSTWCETSISRTIDVLEPVRTITCPTKLNMLVVIPQNSGLDTTAERQILEKIQSTLSDKIHVDFLPGLATSTAIRAAFREKKYHIFHYAGHGGFKDDQAFIYLDHEAKPGAQPGMSAKEFAQFFSDYPCMRLVMLNACQGAACSFHNALIGTSLQLLLAGVPAVVAMQYVISNDDAILFANEFYETLCREDGQVEIALTAARKALRQERPGSLAFGNPVLYLRPDNARLWKARSRGLRTLDQVVESLQTPKHLRVAAAFILLVAFVVWRFLLSSGESISIAVLDFENQTQDPELGGILADLLITDLAQNPHVETLNKTRILELSHEVGLKKVDLTFGLSLCQQESIQVLVSGKVAQKGEAFRIEANAFDVKSKNHLFT